VSADHQDPVFDAETFPEQLYLMAFGDVREAVLKGDFDSGYAHYKAFGKQEIASGRRHSPFKGGPPGLARSVLPPAPSTDPVPPAPPPQSLPGAAGAIPYTPPKPPRAKPAAAAFSVPLYLATNPDVAALIEAGATPSAEAHWQAQGKAETEAGLRPTLTQDSLYTEPPPPPPAPDLEKFDGESYLLLYPDVLKALGPNPDAARAHYLHHGRFEARIACGLAPCAAMQASPEALLQKPFGLNIFAPFAAVSGLGTAARNILRAIETTAIPFELHAFDVARGQARITAAARARAPRYRCNLILANADQIAQLVSIYEPGTFDNAYNIAVWAWELAAFRPDWQLSFASLDEIWTNSDFEVASISATSPLPVHKIRLPVEPAHAPPREGRTLFGIPQDRLTFMAAFDAGSTSARKNPLAAVEAFREAFTGEENVFLIVKFHQTALEPAITRQISRALRGADNVLVIADVLTDRDMALLRAACDVFISPHRSEGFGLNLAEFMALGKPVIATNYSGNLEFFDEAVGYPVDFDLVEIATQSASYMPHYIWAEPRRASLVAALRAVYENQSEAWAKGRRAAKRMKQGLRSTAIGADIVARLKTLGMDGQKPNCLSWFGKTRAMTGAAPLRLLQPAARRAVIALGAERPVISLIVPVYNVPAHLLQACVFSVFAQTYPLWELCLYNDASTESGTLEVLQRLQGIDPRIRIRHGVRNLGIAGASNAAAEMSTGAWLAMLDNDDTLHPDALLDIAGAIVANPDIDVIYTDEDKIDEQGRRIDTYFKPDWSPEHLESVMYVLHLLVARKKLFLELGGFRQIYSGAQDYDLMLRLSRKTQRIHHIAKPLYHWRAVAGSAAAQVDAKPYALDAGFRALSDHVAARHGERAHVEKGLLPGTFRVRRQILGQPRVSLLILTNNGELDLPGRGRFHMVDNLVDSILRRTAYRNYEIVVVDNSSLKPAQIDRFRGLGVRVENYPGSVKPFNYSAKANYALRICRTEHLVYLNDDMEVTDPDWLTALLEISQDPEIGAVGGRLLHADGSVQHVGCVIGVNGGSVHVYHSYPGEFIGYNGFTHLIRNYSAVTGACFATRKSVLAQLGGFDESYAIDFNDIDLCLRLIEAGYRIVYTPYCTLFHFEGASAKRVSANPDERKRFIARWPRYMENDPHFNPNFSKRHFDFTSV
jgi:GT2 family glycosyltransferase/glycosyltransferase involved in cell wall biosynthesis